MFERLRETMREAMGRASSPGEGRAALALMRQAVVEAKVAVSQVRAALAESRAVLERERADLVTVQRRKGLAAEIRDEETVRVAERFEHRHTARIAVLERKISAQEAELALGEREVEEMTTQLRAVASGVDPAAAHAATAGLDAAAAAAAPPPDEALNADLDALRRRSERAARDAEAERQLAELKRRMNR